MTTGPHQPESITPLPPHRVTRPVMLQGWHDLTALHWQYEPAQVQALLPSGFTVDTFDGSAWVGLIPFHMSRIRVPGLPPFGRLSTFPETNVRTYIVDPAGRRGVWFFSLDVTRLIPAMVARIGYRLPYCWANMTLTGDGPGAGSQRHYTSDRRWPSPSQGLAGSTKSIRSSVRVQIGERIAEADLSDLDHFLTARWALGTTFGRHLMWAKVDHPPWILHEADVIDCDESLIGASGLDPPTGEPIARWSPGVEVRIGLPRRIKMR
jgi:uncharacterized protein